MNRIKNLNPAWYDVDAQIQSYQLAADWFYAQGYDADARTCDDAVKALTAIKDTLDCALAAMDEAEML